MLVGVAGGTASGKTSVCREVMKALEGWEEEGLVASFSQDAFYRDLSAAERRSLATYNFDHPDAFDFGEMLQAVRNLKAGAPATIPHYDFVTSSRLPDVTTLEGPQVILLEGLFTLYDASLRDLLDLKIFVDADSDTRLARRLRRDIAERGRDAARVLDQYETTVKPSFDNYILPTKRFADIVIPRGAENTVAIELVLQYIELHLRTNSDLQRA